MAITAPTAKRMQGSGHFNCFEARTRMVEPNPFTTFEYYAYADQFYDAFNKLGAEHLHPSVSWPRYFLLCHSIELALKAYLAKLGATTEHLKFEFGHKLDELVTEAVEKGLSLTTRSGRNWAPQRSTPQVLAPLP